VLDEEEIKKEFNRIYGKFWKGIPIPDFIISFSSGERVAIEITRTTRPDVKLLKKILRTFTRIDGIKKWNVKSIYLIVQTGLIREFESVIHILDSFEDFTNSLLAQITSEDVKMLEILREKRINTNVIIMPVIYDKNGSIIIEDIRRNQKKLYDYLKPE